MPSGKSSRINGAYNSGPQDLIDTILKNLGVPINHYVEVNFDGFKGLVEAVDGVPLYFSQPVRDRNSGLRVARSGCYTLNGVQALAFARARHLQYFDGTRWRTDGTGDLGRITRQQIFLRHAVGKLSTLGLTDLSSMRQLVNVAIDTVRLDATLGADEILSLGQKFRHFDSKSMVMHSLPADPFTTSSGAAVLKLEKTAAQPVLSIFNGKRPTTTVQATTTTVLAPEAITVDVKNAAGTPGLARNVATMLGSGGFVIGEVGNAATATASTVRYGTGAEASAKLVAERVTPHPKVVADSTLAAGKVVFVAAAEPESVAKSTSSTKTTTTIKQASTSAKSSTTTVKQSGTSAKSASTNGSSTAGSGSPTTTAAGATSDPAEGHTIGLKVGDPPPGVTCG
jgi:LCP family protein required for cell wall assembly